jgi:DNA (cytosine-5)-methyltransferase 1
MPAKPNEILETALQLARENPIIQLPNDCIKNLEIIVWNADKQKAVLGATLTSSAYKVFNPNQDIRLHQEGMTGGYSARTFDTKFTTPFVRRYFPHFAMAESAWLTRSLEQPHPFTLDFLGKIRNPLLKTAFLQVMDFLEHHPNQAVNMLTVLFTLLLEITKDDDSLFGGLETTEASITKIIDAITQHIRYSYPHGTVGTARLPVLAIYAMYQLLLPDLKRYQDKILAPLESHTSPDLRSKALGDIDVLNADRSAFEAIEVKHNKPISAEMIDIAYQKIKTSQIERYYILTTNEPNIADQVLMTQTIEKYKQRHTCQFIVNGVIPSLKYYLRLISQPQEFLVEYTSLLETEFKRGSGIKKEHLQIWQQIRQTILNQDSL